MSKARKPLEMQSKHLTSEEIAKKEMEEESIILGREHLEEPPDWLVDDVAKDEFRRIVCEFEKVGVIGNLDLNNLGGYCNSYSFYLQATKELQGNPLASKKMTKNGPTIVKHPYIEIQKNYADEMRKFAPLCGLTIDSRLKVATIKTTSEQEEIIDEFGDI